MRSQRLRESLSEIQLRLIKKKKPSNKTVTFSIKEVADNSEGFRVLMH